jgi:F0F1-type ATP synthase assembly protein I
MKERGAKKTWYVLVGEYTALAFALPLATFIGYAGGYLLDRAIGTSFLRIIGLLLGIAAGLAQVVRQFQRDTKSGGS